MSSQSKVCFYYSGVKFSFPERGKLKRFIESIFKREKRSLQSINYIFCNDKALLKINQDFLKHDYYTDIITFDLSESSQVVAEIYISIDRVRDNARNLGVSFQKELQRVIFHGALHLCGYKDKTKADSLKMRDKEDYYLKSYSYKRST